MSLIIRVFLKKDSSVAKIVIGLYPGFTDLHYVLGLAHYENENYRQAEYVFKQCISMGDAPVPPFVSAGAGCGSHKAKWALGRVYLAQGMYAEACREFRQAFEGNPQLISYLVHMGIAHRAAGTRDNFVTYLKSLDKDDVLKANVLFGAWLYPECLNILETIDESRPELQYLKAVSMAGTGAYDKAEALYQELSSETSKMDTSLVTLTFCHLCMGKCGLETVSDWPGKDKKLLFQMFLTRTLLTLEDKLVKNPQDSFLRENLDTIRKSAKALGFREI